MIVEPRKNLNDAPPYYQSSSVGCEMNKFYDMMAYTFAHDPDFTQVVAIDAKFDLFTRAWCVSELAKAHTMGMKQQLKVLSVRALDLAAPRLHESF